MYLWENLFIAESEALSQFPRGHESKALSIGNTYLHGKTSPYLGTHIFSRKCVDSINFT
jgi:hypothetical protein